MPKRGLPSTVRMPLFTPTVVASTFIIGGFIILWAERRPPGSVRIENVDDMTPVISWVNSVSFPTLR